MITESKLQAAFQLAEQVADRLAHHDRRVVFAESCTAGLVSALMASVSGISQWMCGSFVTYMDSSKIEWLGVEPELIERHTSVSAEVTQAMAAQVLRHCSEADIAMAVTGHLEPPEPHTKPHAFVSLADRCANGIVVSPAVYKELSGRTRVTRQYQAAMLALQMMLQHLNTDHDVEKQHADWCEACERMGHATWIRWA